MYGDARGSGTSSWLTCLVSGMQCANISGEQNSSKSKELSSIWVSPYWTSWIGGTEVFFIGEDPFSTAKSLSSMLKSFRGSGLGSGFSAGVRTAASSFFSVFVFSFRFFERGLGVSYFDLFFVTLDALRGTGLGSGPPFGLIPLPFSSLSYRLALTGIQHRESWL